MDSYAFGVGSIACVAVHDGDTAYDATDYVVNGSPHEVERALAGHGHRPEEIPSPYSGLVVRTGSSLVLIDTGAGDLAPNVGRLVANLRRAGIQPADIDTVVLTHGHPDHIGGTTDSAGRPVFARARHVMFRQEWEYWTNEAILVEYPPVFGEWARKNLLPLRDQLELLDAETEIAPGIQAIAAPGHTPGHMALAIRSGSEELLYVSDAALHPIHLEHPQWHSAFDADSEAAIATKRRLFDRAATDGSLVLAFHFPPFPSLGHALRDGRAWRWEPSAAPAAMQ